MIFRESALARVERFGLLVRLKWNGIYYDCDKRPYERRHSCVDYQPSIFSAVERPPQTAELGSRLAKST